MPEQPQVRSCRPHLDAQPAGVSDAVNRLARFESLELRMVDMPSEYPEYANGNVLSILLTSYQGAMDSSASVGRKKTRFWRVLSSIPGVLELVGTSRWRCAQVPRNQSLMGIPVNSEFFRVFSRL